MPKPPDGLNERADKAAQQPCKRNKKTEIHVRQKNVATPNSRGAL